ncbi:hypothetical protein [Acidovorax sp. A1169]|nr:hypothetical protein [Acidovorax sp. A1169]MDP4074271.1 hypothetical protein [Acidovorax sp. A1169]
MTSLVMLAGMDGTGTVYFDVIKALHGEFAIAVITYPPPWAAMPCNRW